MELRGDWHILNINLPLIMPQLAPVTNDGDVECISALLADQKDTTNKFSLTLRIHRGCLLCTVLFFLFLFLNITSLTDSLVEIEECD